VSVQRRRRLVVRRHHLAGDADTPETVVRAVLALHATDPASVYLSVLARSAGTTLGDVADAMYGRRSLVRWMAMRRTLFLFPRDDVPMVQTAVSTPLAAALRRQLVAKLERNGTRPPVDGDLAAWVRDLEERVAAAVRARGAATGAELSSDVPALRTVIPPRVSSDRPQTVTSPLLTIMGASGRLVRGTPMGAWTSRHHRWEPVERWWPQGMPTPDPDRARRALAHRYFARFGPATVEDLTWWTGWSKTTVRRTVEHLPTEEVDLHGRTGLVLRDDDLDDELDDDSDNAAPTAALLPALDPTTTGWSQREWLFGIDRRHVFDRAGNVGPTPARPRGRVRRARRQWCYCPPSPAGPPGAGRLDGQGRPPRPTSCRHAHRGTGRAARARRLGEDPGW